MAPLSTAELIGEVWRLFEPELDTQGYELVEVEFGNEGGAFVLRLYIDKPGGGISHEDCAAVSQLVGPLLDADELMQGSYMLEVSSPGITRPLRKAADFERFAGEEVKIQTDLPIDGRRHFTGTLRGLRDGMVHVDCWGVTFEIHQDNIKKARLNR